MVSDCITKSKLTKLSLWHTTFSKRRRVEIPEAIKRSTIKTLDMRGISFLNRFDAINDLILNQGVTKLKFDLYAFNIGERKALLNSIQKNCLFEHISFDGTIFDEALITKTCELLESAHLKSFDLDLGLLPDDMLDKIINSTKRSSITSLKVRGHELNAKNAATVRDLLENHCLENIGLHFAHIANETIEEMLPSICVSSIIKFGITLWAEPMNDDTRDKIEHILQAHRKIARERRNIKSARVFDLK